MILLLFFLVYWIWTFFVSALPGQVTIRVRWIWTVSKEQAHLPTGLYFNMPEISYFQLVINWGGWQLELPTSTAKPLRPVHRNRNTLATPNQIKQKELPWFQGRLFRISAIHPDVVHFALLSSKIACLLWSWQDSNLWPHRCERCVLTNWTTRPLLSNTSVW